MSKKYLPIHGRDHARYGADPVPLWSPVRAMGRVLGALSFSLGGGKSFVAHGGLAVRVDRELPAGTSLHVDFGHVAPFDELVAAVHSASGWDGTNIVEEPWERRPWNGSTAVANSGASPLDYTPLAFTGAVGLSSATDLSGDTITWTHPVASAEDAGLDTTNGHFGYLFHDFGDGVTDADTHYTFTFAGTTGYQTNLWVDQYRLVGDTVVVDAALDSGSTTENALQLTLPDVVLADTWLVVVSACEKTTADENASTTRPRIRVNWGVDNWLDEVEN